jgi:PAS domain S-box-containing protein
VPIKYGRTIFVFIFIILVFLGVVVAEIVSHKEKMLEDAEKTAHHELELVGTLLRESLLKHDYATVEKFLTQWGEEHEHIVEIEAVAPNGFVLAEYRGEIPPKYTFKVSDTVQYAGKDLIELVVVRDYTSIQESLNKLSMRLIAGAFLLTVLMGAALWFSLRRMALKPLEQEIIARRLAEDELLEARDDLESRVQERTRELMEEREKIRLINNKGCEILGYEEHEVVGKNWFDNFLPEEIRGEIKGVFDRLIAGEVDFVKYLENPILTRDGSERIIAWHNALLKDEQGNPSGTLSSGEDITVRKKAEDELHKLYTTMDTIISHMPEGVFLLDSEGRVTLSNPVGGKYLAVLAGVKVGDELTYLAGRPISELLISPPHILWYDIEADDRVFEVAGKKAGPGKAADEGIVFVLRDVTEERKLGMRMQIQDRLAAVGQLAAGIAHDFNNILTVINGYTEILLTEESLSDKARHEIDIIRQSGNRAMDLIHQVLDFSRKTVGEMEEIEFVTFVKEFLRFMERTLPENISVSFNYVPHDYVVKADVAKLQQVLANLVVNARDAMSEGGDLKVGILPINLKDADKPPLPEMSPGNWMALTISDSGRGIPPDVLPHIFEPFFTTKELGKGTGLGLSQVYGLVKQHGGYIDVKTADKGSSFIVYFPILEEKKMKKLERKEVEMPKGRGQTVLVVEDEGTVLELIGKVIESLGYRAVTAVNGSEAFEVFKERKDEIGLVITDVVMPEMDGIQLSRMIKEMKPSVKVIALSGYAIKQSKEELLEAGVVEFISKPFTVHTLAEVISRVLIEKV